MKYLQDIPKLLAAVAIAAASLQAQVIGLDTPPSLASTSPFDIVELTGYLNGYRNGDFFSGQDTSRIQSNLETAPGAVFFEQSFLTGAFINQLILDQDRVTGGSVTWQVVNSGVAGLDGLMFYAYLDADIDAGEPVDSAAGNAGNYYQIANLGDPLMLTNLFAGTLPRNLGSGPTVGPDDIVMALGFDIGTLDPGQSFSATLSFGNDGLHQFSAGGEFFVTGAVTLPTAASGSVPEPAAPLLLALGLSGIVLTRRKGVGA